jgi:site-specific recombinase XerD
MHHYFLLSAIISIMGSKEPSFISIDQAIKAYLETVSLSRSVNTSRTYQNGLRIFLKILKKHTLDPTETHIEELSEDSVSWFASDLKKYSPATERLYLTALSGFFQFLAAEKLAAPNLPRVQLLIRQRARRPGQRLPQFPSDKIEAVLLYVNTLPSIRVKDQPEGLRSLRDRAFLFTLADTGLRVHEACQLRRGDIDWNEGRAIIIGKGDRQAVVRFSSRSLEALKEYLSNRTSLDGSSGHPLASLPLFARHDKGAGKKVKPITTATGRNIVTQRVVEALGEGAAGMITPHSFRHYFVTTVLKGSGNLKLAQELARHRNIAVTQRYAHLNDDELDKGYRDIFEKK